MFLNLGVLNVALKAFAKKIFNTFTLWGVLKF
jgi:hypothetical protein